MKNLKVLFTVLCVACTTTVWGVTSGTTYTLTTTNGVPTGWTNSGCSLGSKYTSISDGDYLTTDDICVGSLKSIQINARYYGGSGKTAAIKFEFITSDGKTTYNIGTLTPTTNNESASYTLSSFTQSISANSKGYFKISAPNATSSKYAGLKAITFTFTTGTCGSTETTPTITLQPESATYNQGATATALTITADGNPTPTYQWYSNNSKSNTNGTKISGATEASYTPSTATAGTFYYYCVATNSKGSAPSDVATITVNAFKTCTIIWSLGGHEYTEGFPTTSVASGSQIATLPTPPDGNAIGSCANTFMGWSTHNLGSKGGQGDPGDLFTTIDKSPVITQDTTFYAVFATKQTN